MAGFGISLNPELNLGGGSGGNYAGYANPGLLGELTKTVGKNGVDASKMYMDFIQNPTGSDLFTKQLAGLLQNPQMQQSRQAATQGLQDQYRSAGNMSSGAFANASANQQGNFNAQDQTLAAQLLGQVFSQMTGALQGPQSMAMQLATLLSKQQPQTSGGMTSSGGTGGEKFPSLGGPTMGGGQATNSSYPGGPATSWAAQDQAYVAQQKALSDAILAQFDQQYGSMGSTYLGANGDYASGSAPGGTPWDPNPAQSQYGGSMAPADPWSFYNDPAGQAQAPAQDWAAMYGNDDGSMEY
jgi:hypothetical protein